MESKLESLINAYNNSPYPSFKVTNYFPIYVDLFSQLVNTECTFIETGILNGGSLFMWRKWLGEKARIIGVDLNPSAKKWEQHGFEIYIGDQGDPKFWLDILPKIGSFDVLLDDGGHQSFQQIVTLVEAIKFGKNSSLIVIEDTVSSHLDEFSKFHRNNSFLEYAKRSTDILSSRNSELWPGQYPVKRNKQIIDLYENIYSIQFYTGIVAFKINSSLNIKPELVSNQKKSQGESDYRYAGKNSATVLWPDPFEVNTVVVNGKD
jgi:hypothetical protein